MAAIESVLQPELYVRLSREGRAAATAFIQGGKSARAQLMAWLEGMEAPAGFTRSTAARGEGRGA